MKSIKSYSNNSITTNDGAKGKIIDNGQLDYFDLPCLNDVVLVDELTTNLISIT